MANILSALSGPMVERSIVLHADCTLCFKPSGHGNIHGKFQECFWPTFKNDPLIVQNENCMIVQVRMFIECSELNAK